ncbi:phosphoribosylglycinamide formyltransferase [Aquipuribacter nitratireducens]|uniref:Phosphoribosylglycinamide formyltransferase n=1 Tax=Aquipuribacter nitratireducens TaxID=650104 RepID=A0ABW0GM00_9MICO
MPAPRLVVLASGTGSLLEALLAATGDGRLPVDVVGFVADRDCRAVEVAQRAGVPTAVVRPQDQPDRAAWDAALADHLQGLAPDWVVSAGFMRILGEAVLAAFPDRVVNTHPALLPSFPGAHAVRDALAHGVRVSGCTVHLVDAGTDTGPVLAQAAVPVLDDDDEASLHERIKVVERGLLVEVLAGLAVGGVEVVGRRTRWRPARPAPQ